MGKKKTKEPETPAKDEVSFPRAPIGAKSKVCSNVLVLRSVGQLDLRLGL